MSSKKRHRLIEIDWPEFDKGNHPSPPTLEELEDRICKTQSSMERHGMTHLVVYADREHFANMVYLTHFDPRFEEALFILDLKHTPLMLVGNECEARLPVSPLFTSKRLRFERFQPFSLLSQPRKDSRFLKEIFDDEGIGENAVVGCVGWKYMTDAEHPHTRHAIDMPAYIVDTLRELAGYENVTNATEIFMHPGAGFRTFCSPSEIAFFEYSNILASEGMKRLIFGIEEGMTDYELAKKYEVNGLPLCCHISMQTGGNLNIGLTGPSGTPVKRGDPFSTNIGYWGSNICRAGWIADSAEDLPFDAREYIDHFAGPYFEVMGEWFQALRIGTPGEVPARLIAERLPFETFGIYLNPGHLIHLDEWVSSPIYRDSDISIHSGMYIQTDVIPFSKTYYSTRMEDGIIIADQALRKRVETQYPECYARCLKRRVFMTEILGIDLPEEILPLSNIPAIVPPFFLRPNTVFAFES